MMGVGADPAGRAGQPGEPDEMERCSPGFEKAGVAGAEFVVSDDHAGLKPAIAEVIPEPVWQRCNVHFLSNALDHLTRKAVDDCLQELRGSMTAEI
jgi:transposase-like protein